jgi:hypothetical protein
MHNFNTLYNSSPMLGKVTISPSYVTHIESKVSEIISKKQQESHHKVDPFNEQKRWMTGFLGERAIEQFLGTSFMDMSVGDSKNYHVSDLSKLNLPIGVKTVEYGKFPLVFKGSRKPEIIVVKIDDNNLVICGLAMPDVLNTYQDDELILSPSLRKRNTKSGFYGFDKLLPFTSLYDLQMMTVPYYDGVEYNGYSISLDNGMYKLVNKSSGESLVTHLGSLNRKILERRK